MTRFARHKRAAGDEGMVMVMALAFLFLMSIVIFALLGQVDANFRTTRIVKSRGDRMYAADAALEWGIQKLKLDPTICSAAGGPTTIANVPTFNGRDVTLKCTPTFGTDLGASGWAVIATGTLSKQSGGDPTITGPVFATGDISVQGGGNLIVKNGNVVDKYSSCAGKSAPGGLSISPTPPYGWQCTTTAAPDPAHVLPAVPVVIDPPALPVGGCKVFSPGKYTTAPTLGNDNFFVSGVYYFENIGLWTVDNNTKVIGGTPQTPGYEVPGLPGACSAVSDANGTGATGSGVEFIFGGNSAIEVKNNTGVELFSRVPASGDTSTGGISVLAVPATGGGYLQETVGTLLLNVTTGGAGFSSHGLVYAPNADINLFASSGTIAQLQNGVVGRNIALQASNVGSGLAITVDTAVHARTVLLTATAASTGEGDVAADARAEIRNDTAPPTMVVQVWRTCTKAADASLPLPACP
ncbi:MAG: hypothetical protein QOI95_278 [Acidimicrobiaceae bacterium]|jgi:hypothetical protein